MSSLYLEYKDNKKLQPLAAEFSWTHNLILMEKCEGSYLKKIGIT